MSFYFELSNFYEGVFPLNSFKLKFIENNISHEGLTIDVACGVGTDTIALNKQGFEIEGFDLESEMIVKAYNNAKNEGLNLNFFEASMLNIKEYYEANSVKNILCTGNSLVHLNSKEDIQSFINQCYAILENNGTLLMQIINFDRVLDNNVTELPTIVNKERNLTFVRNYEYCAETQKIKFITKLQADREYKNVINLVPLRQQELANMLHEAGFNNPAFFGSFKGDVYKPDSYATIVVARK